MLLCHVLAACTLLLSDGEDFLEPGLVIEQSVTIDAATVTTEALYSLSADRGVRGRAFTFSAPSGEWTIELRSKEFDGYLIVMNEDGGVVGEDNNGLGVPDARVVFEAPETGSKFTVWACALWGVTGKFELRAVAGDAPIPTRSIDWEDASSFVDAEYAKHGLADAGAVANIKGRAQEHILRREYLEAIEVLETALVPLDPTDKTHRLAQCVFRKRLMAPLGRLGRRAEAVECGLLALPTVFESPEDSEQCNVLFSIAYNMWRLARLEEGLELMDQWEGIAASVLPARSPELSRGHALWISFLRSAGRWEEAIEAAMDVERAEVWHPGESRESTIELIVPLYQVTGVMNHNYTVGPARFECIPFRVERSGSYTIDLSSFEFDAYLVLRNERGAVLAEDDDGRILTDSRIVVELIAGEIYLAESTALHNRFGRYRLDLIEGTPAELSPWDLRKFELAEARRCRKMADEWSGVPTLELTRILNHAAYVLSRLGRYDDALEIRKRALEVLGEVLPGSLSHITARSALAKALQDVGRAPEAIPLLEGVLAELQQSRGTKGLTTRILLNLSSAWASRGDYERATELLDDYQAIIEREGGTDTLLYMGAVSSQAWLAERRGLWTEAVEQTQRFVDWHLKYGSGGNPGGMYLLANAYSRLGFRQSWTGDLEGARHSLEEALRRNRIVYGGDSTKVASSQLSFAWILNRSGELDRALEEWETANAVVNSSNARGFLSRSLIIGAELNASVGDHERAFALALQAMDVGNQDVAQHLATLPEPLRLREAGRQGWTMGVLLGLAGEVEGSERATYERIVPHKTLVGRGLIESRAGAQATLDPATRATIMELQGVQSELAKAFHEGDEGLHETLRAERIRLEDELARSSASTGSLRPVSVRELSQALPGGAVLVDFFVSSRCEPARVENGVVLATDWWKEEHVTAWIVRAGVDTVERVDLGPAELLQDAMRGQDAAGRDLLASRGIQVGEAPQIAHTGGRLRELLWDPIAGHVADAPLVFVSTFGFLGTVPFDALPLDDGTFLIEHHAFVHLSDPSVLLDVGSASEVGESSLLLVGDVNYDQRGSDDRAGETRSSGLSPVEVRGPGGDSWARLPYTALEVDTLARLFNKRGRLDSTTRLTGVKATEEAVVRELSAHAWVHIATHGFFQPEGATSMWDSALSSSPVEESAGQAGLAGLFPGLLSGLVLAGANEPAETGRDDGRLTAEELTWLDLSGCELVTLSACETGLGSARAGEGLVGLRRAFHQAGARTVVASLWAVEDKATSRLMESFYHYLWVDGLPRGQALRAAQLDLLNANRQEHGEARPRTWGAFVLSGEWR